MKIPVNIKYKVDPVILKKEILESMSKKNTLKTFENNLRVQKGELLVKKIKRAKEEMIKDFLGLKITQEILMGPGGTNVSGTLGGYGNLFSFIGFNLGDDPIDPIIHLLNQTNYRLTHLSTRGTMKIIIDLPSRQDIFAATPLPWAPGISWAERMEVGLSGLGMYLSKSSDKSRSGAAVQVGHEIRAGGFSNVPYISAFIKKWKNIFSKIDKNISSK